MLILQVEIIGGIGLEDILQRVTAVLHGTVMGLLVNVGVITERRGGKHVVGHHGSTIAFLIVIDITESIIKIDGEVLQRIEFCTNICPQVGRCKALTVAILDVGNGRTEWFALIIGIRIPTRPTHKIEPSVVLARGIAIGLVVVRTGKQDIGAYLPPILDGSGDVAMQGKAVVFICIELHDTLLVEVAHTDIVGSLFVTARNGEVMVLLWRPFAGKLLDRIKGTIKISMAVLQLKVASFLHFAQLFLRHAAILFFPCSYVINRIFVDRITDIRLLIETFTLHNGPNKIGIISGRGYFGHFGGCVPSEVIGVRNLYFVIMIALLGSDQDNTPSRTGTINRSRSGVLQHGDGLNIVRIDKVKVGYFYVVDQNKWRSSARGAQ